MRSPITLLALAATLSATLAPEAHAFQPGDRVLAKGRLKRSCGARVESLPAPGFAKLSFDRPGCGDAGQPYELSQLEPLQFAVPAEDAPKSALRPGDAVVVKGFLSSQCAARVREVSESGYVSLDFDSLLCADTEALRRSHELRRVRFVKTKKTKEQEFEVGQAVSMAGINKSDTCKGRVARLTSNGLAAVDFDELTCAYSGRLYPLDQLTITAPKQPRSRDSAQAIFDRVMREIASEKKGKI